MIWNAVHPYIIKLIYNPINVINIGNNMTVKKNQLIVHGLGGCGINLTVLITKHLKTLNDGFSNVAASYFDTSLKNIEHYPEDIKEGDYHLVSDNNYSGEYIDGSAGERRTNHLAISSSVTNYLDSKGIKKADNGNYHIVVFSASGGSGSVISPFLAKALISRGIPTVLLVVGDNTTGNLAQNTMNTLASIQSLSKSINKPFVMHYLNNSNQSFDTVKARMEAVDNKMLAFSIALSAFMSGENFALDNQDMNTLIDFTPLTSINLPVGTYNINAYAKDIEIEDGCKAFIGRTLTVEGTSPDTGIDLVHWKSGMIMNKEVLDVFDKEEIPVHLVLETGKIVKEQAMLKKEVEKLRADVKSITPDEIHIDEFAEQTEDGMIL